MRNIFCSEDKQCTLEPMASINQSGGGPSGLIAGEDDYVIPLRGNSIAKRPRKQTGGGKVRRQTGRGKVRRQTGKGKASQKGRGRGRKRVSRPKACGKTRRKYKQRSRKAVPWKIQ